MYDAEIELACSSGKGRSDRVVGIVRSTQSFFSQLEARIMSVTQMVAELGVDLNNIEPILLLVSWVFHFFPCGFWYILIFKIVMTDFSISICKCVLD